MLIIKSTHNSVIKNIKKIMNNYSDYPNEFFVEGIRAASLFAFSPYFVLNEWFVAESVSQNLPYFIKITDKISFVTDNILAYLSRSSSPSGVLGYFSLFKKNNAIFSHPTFVLYNLSDPGNVGAIIRTAVALGRKEIILIDGVHPNSYKVIQSSAGTIAHIRVIRTTWNNFLKYKIKEFPICGLDMNGEKLNLISSNELALTFLLVGNEAHGIDSAIKKDIDRNISIPMELPCESLNVAIAASVVGYKSWKNIYE